MFNVDLVVLFCLLFCLFNKDLHVSTSGTLSATESKALVYVSLQTTVDIGI